MTSRRILKPLIVGLALLSLMLQVCFVALQLSIFIAPKAGSIDAALNVVCTAHGAVVPPAEEAPSDCGTCPLCSQAESGVFAVLQSPAHVLTFTPGRSLAFDFDHDLHFARFLFRPQSRGPPKSA